MTGKKAILIHGWGGTYPGHWQGWLKTQLEQNGFEVDFPLLPKPDFPIEQEWVAQILNRIPKNKPCFLVGHSLGGPTILRVLEQLPSEQKIDHAVFVASFCRDLKIPEIENFVNHPFDWKKIKQQCKRFTVVFSDNDPYVPRYQCEFLAEQLKVQPLIEKDGGHITSPQFGPYPRLLQLILDQAP